MAKSRAEREPVVQPLDKSYRLIPLTQGQVALVDAADYDWLMRFNWCAIWNPHIRGFYASRQSNYRMVLMHRQILGEDTPEADHKNRNTLDNRRNNLRPCTRSQNIANTSIHRDNISGYRGVSWDRRQWRARIVCNGREITIGRFPDKEAAARAYDNAALKSFGEFAHLNFPAS